VLSQQFDAPLCVTHYPAAVKAFYMKSDPQQPDITGVAQPMRRRQAEHGETFGHVGFQPGRELRLHAGRDPVWEAREALDEIEPQPDAMIVDEARRLRARPVPLEPRFRRQPGDARASGCTAAGRRSGADH